VAVCTDYFDTPVFSDGSLHRPSRKCLWKHSIITLCIFLKYMPCLLFLWQ